MLIRTVERFLAEKKMPRTKFGRLAAHDPRFFDDLRSGREPRPALTLRVDHLINISRSTSHLI